MDSSVDSLVGGGKGRKGVGRGDRNLRIGPNDTGLLGMWYRMCIRYNLTLVCIIVHSGRAAAWLPMARLQTRSCILATRRTHRHAAIKHTG